MLKKIVKYGNSNAIVLDKTILALLDLNEGDIVKLKIEGNQLIVKAADNISPKQAFLTAVDDIKERSPFKDDPLMNIMETKANNYVKEAENDPSKTQLLETYLPNSKKEIFNKETLKELFLKYQDELKIFASEEFLSEVNKLKTDHQTHKNDDKYMKDFQELRLKFCPKVAEFDKQLLEISNFNKS